MDAKKIGRFIAVCRMEKGLTQAALAAELGVTDKAVSRWETGRGMPDISILPALSDALGITISELLAGERIEKEAAPKVAEQLLVSALSEKQRIVRGAVSICIASVCIMLLVLFIFYGPAIFQRGNPLPYLQAMTELHPNHPFAEVPRRDGELISLLGEEAEKAVLAYIEEKYDAVLCNQFGSAFVFEKDEVLLQVMTEVYWSRFRVWSMLPQSTVATETEPTDRVESPDTLP